MSSYLKVCCLIGFNIAKWYTTGCFDFDYLTVDGCFPFCWFAKLVDWPGNCLGSISKECLFCPDEDTSSWCWCNWWLILIFLSITNDLSYRVPKESFLSLKILRNFLLPFPFFLWLDFLLFKDTLDYSFLSSLNWWLWSSWFIESFSLLKVVDSIFLGLVTMPADGALPWISSVYSMTLVLYGYLFLKCLAPNLLLTWSICFDWIYC